MLVYDAVMVLADAMKRARSLDGEGLRRAIAETKGVGVMSGEITLDESGDPINKMAAILKFDEEGKSIFVKSIIPR